MFLKAAASAAAVLGAAVAATMVGAAYRFDTTRASVPLPCLAAPVRVALLCDLHVGPFIRSGSVAAWVDAANAVAPDLIVLGGDLMDGRGPGGAASTRGLTSELSRLRAPLGVHAVWGNHDHRRFADPSGFRAELGRAGVRVLVNEGVRVRHDLFLAGVDDLRSGAADLAATVRERPSGAACLLVSHNPDLLPEVPAREVDLTLCGHTHGGQVRLPGVGAMVTSSRYGRRFAQGWVRAPALGYVSRGLGVSTLPIRLACPAELTVMDLVPRA